MDPLTQILLLSLAEVGKAGIQAWFTAQAAQGRTAEEIEAEYQAQKAQFNANRPDLLPDV